MYPKLPRESMGRKRKLGGFALLGGIRFDGRPLANVSREDLFRQGIENQTLKGTLQWPGPITGVIAFLRDRVLGRVRQDELDFLFFEALGDLGQLNVHNLAEILIGQTLENDDLIYPVQKFGFEMGAQRLLDAPLDLL